VVKQSPRNIGNKYISSLAKKFVKNSISMVEELIWTTLK